MEHQKYSTLKCSVPNQRINKIKGPIKIQFPFSFPSLPFQGLPASFPSAQSLISFQQQYLLGSRWIRTQMYPANSQPKILLSLKANHPIINLTHTKYPVLRETANKQEFQIADQMYTLLWTDFPLTVRDFKAEHPETKVNHFPQITQITRKNKMGLNLNTMRLHFPKEYNFFPETYLLPSDHSKILKKHTKGRFYIVKPQNGCQGQGIYLTQNVFKLEKERNLVVQEYIANPMLLDGLKFDLRLYVLITSISPLRVFLYQDGLVRLATQVFEKPSQANLSNQFSHLTNYAINKQSQNFNESHKRLVSSVFKNEDYKSLMSKAASIVVKTIISGLPIMQNALSQTKRTDPNSCFQLLGFDIMLNDKGEAFLLEVNQNPSLVTDTQVDKEVKSCLVSNIFQMVTGGYRIAEQEKMETRVKLKDRHESIFSDGFKKIYPCSSLEETQFYDPFIVKANVLYKERFGLGLGRTIGRKEGKEESVVIWNQNPGHYTQEKVERVYGSGTRLSRTSGHRRRLIFI